MIVVRTPFRVSLFGGGTDFPEWFENYGGSVIGTALNKYCYTSVRWLPPFFKHKSRIVYSKIELVEKIEEIQHPVVRAVLTKLEINKGLEIHHHADLPARSGLGSSSSFTVGLLHAISSLNSTPITKNNLVKDAIHVERDMLQETVGWQDQVWAAHGGFNKIDFLAGKNIQINPITIPEERLKAITNSMMLFFTGLSRYSSDIAMEQVLKLEQNINPRQEILAMTEEAMKLLYSPNFSIKELGELLSASWEKKKQLASNISTDQINQIYTTAMAAGAAGGKVLGSGGGGFMLLLVEPKHQDQVKTALGNLIQVNVGLDHDGSKIVIFEPEGLGNV